MLAYYEVKVTTKGLYIYYVISRRGGSFHQNMTIDDIYLGGSSTQKYDIMTVRGGRGTINMTMWKLDGGFTKKTYTIFSFHSLLVCLPPQVCSGIICEQFLIVLAVLVANYY